MSYGKPTRLNFPCNKSSLFYIKVIGIKRIKVKVRDFVL